MNIETIKHQLRDLRMHTAAAEVEALLAEQRKTVALDWVSSLLARELDARRERAISHRIKRAEFPLESREFFPSNYSFFAMSLACSIASSIHSSMNCLNFLNSFTCD